MYQRSLLRTYSLTHLLTSCTAFCNILNSPGSFTQSLTSAAASCVFLLKNHHPAPIIATPKKMISLKHSKPNIENDSLYSMPDIGLRTPHFIAPCDSRVTVPTQTLRVFQSFHANMVPPIFSASLPKISSLLSFRVLPTQSAISNRYSVFLSFLYSWLPDRSSAPRLGDSAVQPARAGQVVVKSSRKNTAFSQAPAQTFHHRFLHNTSSAQFPPPNPRSPYLHFILQTSAFLRRPPFIISH
jgi:hypothetical protein